MKLKLAVFFLILLLSSPTLACWGYRAMGMGGAFVGLADDANLAYWNRAGAGQLDNWHDGQSQITMANLVLNQNKLFDRTARAGNTYYDSINFAQKINKDLGWSTAFEWSGGGSIALSPSIGFRLPGGGVFDKMSLGLGYYLWLYESSADINNDGAAERLNITYQQLHLDYLWKVYEEFNFGIHIERFWQLSYNATSPDVAGWSQSGSSKIAESMNFRPGIAWIPQGSLKGLIVNAGIYDLFAQGGGPHYSFGFEYTPQPGMRKIVTGKGKNKKVKYVKEQGNWLTNSHFRGGIYNMLGQGSVYSLLTLGYGYNFSENLEIGYWGGFGFDAGSGYQDQNFGITWTW